jgi:hypothetical protein
VLPLIAWWLVLLAGLATSALFLFLHRPRNWFRPAALNATGWVLVIFLLYLRSVIMMVINDYDPKVVTFHDTWIQLVMCLAIDALLIFRVWTFLKYQRTHRPQLNWHERDKVS